MELFFYSFYLYGKASLINRRQYKLEIRNIAIIAHVDHGKTTLVDHLLQQNGVFESHREVTDRHMDSMDLEKEKGITISAKNASFQYKGVKVNVIDTPGHGDFGGEVERILDMVDGAILLVDCSEGPLPQTRFVLQKALDKKLKILVCVNKIDRKDARTQEVLDEIFSLLIDLGAPEDMIDLKPLYAIGKDGKASKSVEGVEAATDLSELLDEVLEQVPPRKWKKIKTLP